MKESKTTRTGERKSVVDHSAKDKKKTRKGKQNANKETSTRKRNNGLALVDTNNIDSRFTTLVEEETLNNKEEQQQGNVEEIIK